MYPSPLSCEELPTLYGYSAGVRILDLGGAKVPSPFLSPLLPVICSDFPLFLGGGAELQLGAPPLYCYSHL